MNCTEAKSLLTNYLLGDLDEAQASAVRAHVETCETCSAEAADIQPTLDLLREALADTAPAPAKLDAGRHAGIYAAAPVRRGKVVGFLTGDYPRSRRAAALFLGFAFLWIVSGEVMWRSSGEMYSDFGAELPPACSNPLAGPLRVFLPQFKMGEVVSSPDIQLDCAPNGPMPRGGIVARRTLPAPEEVDSVEELPTVDDYEPSAARYGGSIAKSEGRRNADSSVIFAIPDIDEKDIDKLMEEQTAVTYQGAASAKAGKMGKGGAPKPEMNEALDNARDLERELKREIEVKDERLADRDLELKNLKQHIRMLEIETRKASGGGSVGLETAIVLPEPNEPMPPPAAMPVAEDISIDGVPATKAPVIMKGIYGSRSPGARGVVLSRSGGSSAKAAVTAPEKPAELNKETVEAVFREQALKSGGGSFGGAGGTLDAVGLAAGNSVVFYADDRLAAAPAGEFQSFGGQMAAGTTLDATGLDSGYRKGSGEAKPKGGPARPGKLESAKVISVDEAFNLNGTEAARSSEMALATKGFSGGKRSDISGSARDALKELNTPLGVADVSYDSTPDAPADSDGDGFLEKVPLVGRLFKKKADVSGTRETGFNATVIGDSPLPSAAFEADFVMQAPGARTDAMLQTADADDTGPASGGAAKDSMAAWSLTAFKEKESGERDGRERAVEEAVRGVEKARTMKKLNEIVIPDVDFRGANLRDVLEFLQEQTVAFDKDGQSGEKGLNVALTLPDVEPAPSSGVDPFAAAAAPQAAGESDVPLITFSARYLTAQQALDIITEVSNTKYTVGDDGKIQITEKDAPESDIVQQIIDVPEYVPKDLLQKKQEDWKGYYAGFGVGWPSGSSITYMPQVGKLMVANTSDNLEELAGLQTRIEEEEAARREAEERLKEDAAKEQTRFVAYGVNPIINVSQNNTSTFSIDVDTASYTLARNYIEKGSLPPAESVRTEEIVNYFDYDYKAPTHKMFAVYAEVAPSKFGRGKQLLKIGVKGKRLGREEQRRAVLTFLIDTSGSMEKPDRIGLVKKSLKMLVDKLGENDLVSIVQYDSRARLVLAHTEAGKKQKIKDAIDGLQCSGSTNLEEGMDKAYEAAAKGFISKGENRVLILSDGVANLGNLDAEAVLSKVEKYRKQGIYCSVFGVGMGTYDDVMLETLANKGDGTYAFLDSEEEAKRLFVDDLASTLNTIARDVKIQVEFNRDTVEAYRQLGYENRQLTKEQFRDDTVDAGEVGSGQSVTALYELDMAKQPVLRAGSIRKLPESVATVRVRYRRCDTDAVEEIEIPVTFEDFVNDFNKADVRFKLAACAAEFAEILRGSPYAQGSDYRAVSKELAPVALELDLDQRVQEFMRMTTSAPGMARGQ